MEKKVGMCTGPSRMDDSAFIYNAWSGLRKVREDLDVKTTIIEAQDAKESSEHIAFLSEKDYDLVWVIGYDMLEPLEKAVDDFPGQKFAIVDAHPSKTSDNLISVNYREQEGAFLAGYIAAKSSQTGMIGFLGGKEVPVIQKFQNGYTAGAKMANPDINISVKWANSFISYERGQVIGEDLYNEGCDIVFHAAGAVGKGLIRKASEMGKYVIGVDIDQTFLAPQNVITSMLKKVKKTIYQTTRDILDGGFDYPNSIELGIKEGMIDLTDISVVADSQNLQAEIQEVKQKIINGEIITP